MIHHHNNRGKKLANRVLGVCLTLVLLCSAALPGYAAALEGNAGNDQPKVTVSEPADPNADKPSVDEKKQSENPTESDGQKAEEKETEKETEKEEDTQVSVPDDSESLEENENVQDGDDSEVTEEKTEDIGKNTENEEKVQLPDNGSVTDETNEDTAETENETTESASIAETEPIAVFGMKQPDGGTTYADAVEDENYIVVQKTFAGISEEQIPSDFAIQVNAANGTKYELKKGTYEWKNLPSDKNIVWQWTINGVGEGSYTVTESNEQIDNYNVTTAGDSGEVVVEAATFKITTEEYGKTCSHTDWNVKVSGDKNFIFAAALTNQTVAVISRYPLTASQRARIQNFIKNEYGGNWKTANTKFYSVEKNGNSYSINGAIVTYDPENEQILLGKTSDWTHVASLAYSISEASNPEISLTNTYTPKTQAIKVRKIVEGGLGDRTKEFAFEYSYIDASGKTVSDSFRLKHGDESSEIIVPIGNKITITEHCDDYDMTAEYGNTPIQIQNSDSDLSASFSVAVKEGVSVITVTNTKEPVVDVGVRMDTIPYIISLLFVLGGAMLFWICRRRENQA